jgi:hypothetical protein
MPTRVVLRLCLSIRRLRIKWIRVDSHEISNFQIFVLPSRKDRFGSNVFEVGFLRLDNVGCLTVRSRGFLQYENPQVQIIVPIPRIESVHKVLMDKHSVRLANNGDVAGGQLAVFQGASEAPISESYGSSEQRGKTANWPRSGGLR